MQIHHEGDVWAVMNRIKAEKLNISQQRFAAMKGATVRPTQVWKGDLAKFKVCVLTWSFDKGQTWSLKEDADYFEIEEGISKDDEKKLKKCATFLFKMGKSKRRPDGN